MSSNPKRPQIFRKLRAALIDMDICIYIYTFLFSPSPPFLRCGFLSFFLYVDICMYMLSCENPSVYVPHAHVLQDVSSSYYLCVATGCLTKSKLTFGSCVTMCWAYKLVPHGPMLHL